MTRNTATSRVVFGGPIIHNKLFFFFSYEGLRLSNTVINRSAHLETPAFEKYVATDGTEQHRCEDIQYSWHGTENLDKQLPRQTAAHSSPNPAIRTSTRLGNGISPERPSAKRSGTDRTGFPIGVSTTFGCPTPAAATSTTAAWITPWEQITSSPALTLLA